MEFQRPHAIFFEVENKVFLQKIGSRHLVNELPESLSAKKHFIAVIPGHFNRFMPLAKVLDIGETVPIEAYDPLIPFLSGSDLF
jgi:hypothetical protein